MSGTFTLELMTGLGPVGRASDRRPQTEVRRPRLHGTVTELTRDSSVTGPRVISFKLHLLTPIS